MRPTPAGCTAGLCAAVLFASPAAAQDEAEDAAVTWGVNPSSQDGPDGRAAFDYELDPGETRIDFVGVSNFSAEPITVDLYASDAFTSAGGAFDLLPSDTEPIDVGSWIGFNEQSLTIEPETRLDVPFALTVPANATPGDHVGGIVAAVTERATEGGNEFLVERRVGARVHMRVTGELEPVLTPQIDAQTYHFEWNPIEPGSLTFDYAIENTGNVRLQGALVARVSGPWDLMGRELAVAELPQILPGDRYFGTANLEGVWPLAHLDIVLTVRPEAVNEADSASRLISRSDETGLWAPPWPQAAVVAALALTVWLIVKIRKRRRLRAVPAVTEPETEKEPVEA